MEKIALMHPPSTSCTTLCTISSLLTKICSNTCQVSDIYSTVLAFSLLLLSSEIKTHNLYFILPFLSRYHGMCAVFVCTYTITKLFSLYTLEHRSIGFSFKLNEFWTFSLLFGKQHGLGWTYYFFFQYNIM